MTAVPTKPLPPVTKTESDIARLSFPNPGTFVDCVEASAGSVNVAYGAAAAGARACRRAAFSGSRQFSARSLTAARRKPRPPGVTALRPMPDGKPHTLRLGTRGSLLARMQSQLVADQLM